MDTRLGLNLDLAPHTEYVVAIDRGLVATGGGGASLRFTTGAGPATDVLPAPPIIDKAAAMPTRPLSSMCREARSIGYCFDTGDPGQLVLETKSQAALFVVHWQPPVPQTSSSAGPYTIHWPATCGHPAAFGSTCFGSYRISAVGLTGESVSRDYVCPEPRDPRTVVAGQGQGCSMGGDGRTGGAGHGALLLVLLAGLGFALGSSRLRAAPAPGCPRCPAR
jgi:hypothetical protein